MLGPEPMAGEDEVSEPRAGILSSVLALPSISRYRPCLRFLVCQMGVIVTLPSGWS